MRFVKGTRTEDTVEIDRDEVLDVEGAEGEVAAGEGVLHPARRVVPAGLGTRRELSIEVSLVIIRKRGQGRVVGSEVVYEAHNNQHTRQHLKMCNQLTLEVGLGARRGVVDGVAGHGVGLVGRRARHVDRAVRREPGELFLW